MSKAMKFFIGIIAGIILLVGSLHFIPLSSVHGYPNSFPNTICGETGNCNDTYRFIPDGKQSFENAKHEISPNCSTNCDPRINLRFYLW